VKVFQYVYFRMYKAYERKNDAPETKAFRYISILVICFLLPLFLIFQSTLKRLGAVNDISGYWSEISFYALLGLAFILCRYAFNRQAFVYHEKELAVVQTVVKRFLKQKRSLRNLPLLQVAEGTFGAILNSYYFPHHHCLDHRQRI